MRAWPVLMLAPWLVVGCNSSSESTSEHLLNGEYYVLSSSAVKQAATFSMLTFDGLGGFEKQQMDEAGQFVSAASTHRYRVENDGRLSLYHETAEHASGAVSTTMQYIVHSDMENNALTVAIPRSEGAHQGLLRGEPYGCGLVSPAQGQTMYGVMVWSALSDFWDERLLLALYPYSDDLPLSLFMKFETAEDGRLRLWEDTSLEHPELGDPSNAAAHGAVSIDGKVAIYNFSNDEGIDAFAVCVHAGNEREETFIRDYYYAGLNVDGQSSFGKLWLEVEQQEAEMTLAETWSNVTDQVRIASHTMNLGGRAMVDEEGYSMQIGEHNEIGLMVTTSPHLEYAPELLLFVDRE